MTNKLVRYGFMIAMATFGLWSGSTAALHIEDHAKLSSAEIKHVKVDLPVLVTSISRSGETPIIVRANYSVSVPATSQANPALNDMLSDALLKATIETFTNPSKELLRVPEIAANKIVNLTNENLVDVVIDELHVSNLAVYKYRK